MKTMMARTKTRKARERRESEHPRSSMKKKLQKPRAQKLQIPVSIKDRKLWYFYDEFKVFPQVRDTLVIS